jgi:hypothetical protein
VTQSYVKNLSGCAAAAAAGIRRCATSIIVYAAAACSYVVFTIVKILLRFGPEF